MNSYYRLTLPVLFLAVFTLTSCKHVNVQNGILPPDYLPYAEKLVGTYQGQFEGKSGVLTFSLNGGSPQLKFQDNQMNDILPFQCGSSVGPLLSFDISDNQITSLNFAFDSGSCIGIAGKEITLTSTSASGSKWELSIVKSVITRKVCEFEPGSVLGGVTQVCHWESTYQYWRGSFERSQAP